MDAETMKAWTHSAAGHPSKVLSLTKVPVPILKSPNDVLVRVSRAALHPGASIMLQSCPFIFRSRVAIPETDFSGTVVATGAGVSPSRNLSAGTAVFGSIPVGPHLRTGSGALAEFVVMDADTLVRKPENMTFEEAAGLAVSGCTALALMERAQLKAGDSVLVNGASGGIGHMALQMIKHAVGDSGRVVAICSEKSIEMVKGLGADEVIDYREQAPVHQYLSEKFSNPRFDVVIDAFGVQELYMNSSDYLREGKPFVTVGPAATEYTVYGVLCTLPIMIKNLLLPSWLGGGKRPYSQVAAVTTREGLEKLAKLVDEGKLKLMVDSCWGMEDALEAYNIMLSHRTRGKVVVKVQSDQDRRL